MKGKLPLSALYCLTIGGLLLAVIWGSRAITVISENMPVERQHCIIIDAGHGGEDGGATSCTGKLESSFNLEISLRLNDLLHLLGYDHLDEGPMKQQMRAREEEILQAIGVTR